MEVRRTQLKHIAESGGEALVVYVLNRLKIDGMRHIGDNERRRSSVCRPGNARPVWLFTA